LLALVLAAGLPVAAQSQSVATAPADGYALADRIFADYVLDAHIPDLVYGIVVDGQLVHVGTYGVDKGPVRRSTVRELKQGSNYPSLRKRSGKSGASACRLPTAYGMGMNVATDCDLGSMLFHSGGYPGYGSHELLLPDRGIGIFAFANRTYAGASAPVWDAAIALDKAGLLGKEREMPVSANLANAYRTLGAMYAAGNVAAAQDQRGSLSLMPTQPPRIQKWVIEPLAP
jgi:CubicO group peptidase (beta-lactamase class C family)